VKILGIDPGTGRMGYGVIDVVGSKIKNIDYGCITTSSKMAMPDRLASIYKQVTEIIEKYQPDRVGVEKLFFAQNVTTAMSVGEARGVAVLAIAQAKVPFFEFTPLQVKQAVTGYGRAEKGQIQKMVQAILGLKELPKPDDAADALAIAITCSTNRLTLN
jgi:crossover junction endodeoxyribonuclease RuvC